MLVVVCCGCALWLCAVDVSLWLCFLEDHNCGAGVERYSFQRSTLIDEFWRIDQS